MAGGLLFDLYVVNERPAPITGEAPKTVPEEAEWAHD